MIEDLMPFLTSLIAVLVSLFSLFYTARDRKSSEVRIAQRTSLEKVIVELGNEIYSVVAMSKRMGLAKENEKYIDNKKLVTESSRRIDQLRKDSRYFLWGLNDGIHTLVLLPKYVEYLRGDEVQVERMIDLATSLREELDLAIKESYQSGTPPSKKSVKKVNLTMDYVKELYETNKEIT